MVDGTLGASSSMDLPLRRVRFEIGLVPKSIFMRLPWFSRPESRKLAVGSDITACIFHIF